MMLNDDIIDCFTTKEITVEQAADIELASKDVKALKLELDLE